MSDDVKEAASAVAEEEARALREIHAFPVRSKTMYVNLMEGGWWNVHESVELARKDAEARPSFAVAVPVEVRVM